MKLFFRISILVLFVGCVSYPKKNSFQNSKILSDIRNPYFANPNQDYIYKANIKIYENTFGGIFIVKKLGDQHHRIVFTTEMGNKLFDLEFNKNIFKVNYILDELNKKILINILKRDFKVLITEKLLTLESFKLNTETIKKTILDNKSYYYYGDSEITKIIRTNKRKEKTVFLFSEISNNIAHRIEIKHFNIKLKINLKSLN